MRQVLGFLALLAFSSTLLGQDVPVPKMLKSLQGQKGQYRVEILEGGGRAGKGASVTVCSDNLIKDAGGDRRAARPGCENRLLKDTDDEAIFESVCKERTTRVGMKREGSSVLMDITSSDGERGERRMKMRYTHLGECKAGSGAITLDKDSEQCQKIRARAEKLDPEKRCARSKDREACEQKLREAAAQLSAMCS